VATHPAGPLEKVIEWAAALAGSPHVFGILIALGTVAIIIGFVCYRSKVARKYDYGVPAGMMNLLQERQKTKVMDTMPTLSTQ
jgi:uncharacterized membrane protein (UPF0136 family)